MQPFKTLTAVAAPLLRDNIDTDTLIPSREIRRVGKTGLADGLFAGWRYLAPRPEAEAAPSGMPHAAPGASATPHSAPIHSALAPAAARIPNPDFVLNETAYANAQILLGGVNFGCGSSREHAVWALAEFGIRAILAPSFAPIFFENCVNNGLLPAMLPEAVLRKLAAAIAEPAQPKLLTVDLQRCTVSAELFGTAPFSIEAAARARLLDGLDAIELTLRAVAAIDAFRAEDRRHRPWVYLGDGS